jgi:large subunit ribosomal protein L25
MTTLNGKNRNTKESLDAMRAEGLLPAVFYGLGKESKSVTLNLKEFGIIYDQVGESQTFTLDVEGEKVDVLVHDVSRHPVSNSITHVDFLAIDTNKPIEVAVPFEFVGASEAERAGGIITKTLYEVEVKALPANIPDSIEVDLSLLENEDSVIHLKELKIPANVELVNDPEKVVASVTIAKEEAEPESSEDAMANIEVEKKGKDDQNEDK